MNEKNVEGVQIWKKVSLLINSKTVIAMLILLFNDRTGNKVTIIQRPEAKETDIFWGLSCDSSLTTKDSHGDPEWNATDIVNDSKKHKFCLLLFIL